MPSLTSASTDAEVEAAFDDNADYDLENSLDKCKAFIQAGRILLRRRETMASYNGRTRQQDNADLRTQLQTALDWFRNNSDDSGAKGASVTYMDLGGFRT